MKRWLLFFGSLALMARGIDLKQGLVLHYSFDNPSATTVTDASGAGCDGTIVNASADAAGVRGGCLRFTGDHSFVRAARNPTASKSYTVSVWFKPDPASIGKLQGTHLIAMNRRYQMGFATNGPHYRLYSFCLNSAGYGYGALRVDSGVFDLVPNRWYHAALLIEDGGAAFFLNGRRLGFISGPGANQGSLDLLIGAMNNDPSAGPRYFFPGWIDEVRIYDRSLSDDEIGELFRLDAPKDLLPPAPVALGPSYVVKDGRFCLRTEKDGHVDERPLTDAETSTLLSMKTGSSAAPATQDNGPVCEIGFSNDARGDQDVTFFVPGETLHVRVRDVDIPVANTNFTVQIFLSQKRDADTADIKPKLKQLDRARDGSYRGAIPLDEFHPGPILVSVIASESGSQPTLMRTSRIEILDQKPQAQR
jgi:hypothetical protein